jgi:hypothetical protein
MVNPLAGLRQSKLRVDKVENVSVPPNTERTLCNRTGPGVVVSLWMALGGGAAPASTQQRFWNMHERRWARRTPTPVAPAPTSTAPS